MRDQENRLACTRRTPVYLRAQKPRASPAKVKKVEVKPFFSILAERGRVALPIDSPNNGDEF